MIDIIVTFIVNFVLFAIFFMVGRALKTHNTNQQILPEDVAQSKPVKVQKIEMSKISDIYYLHDADTKQFLAQGKTHPEIVNILKSRFPNTLFLINDDNINELNYSLGSGNERI